LQIEIVGGEASFDVVGEGGWEAGVDVFGNGDDGEPAGAGEVEG